ncbi:response regulator [Candidatus Campbellbacteria bacterium]|nr:MAG: response regulator [Candidatus Campbellbacteria bacterium]
MDTIQNNQNKQKILMVDDDEFLVSLYQKKAESYPVELHVALSGEDALAQLREGFVPDIIALDVTMAGLSGIDVVKAMRAEKLAPNARVVILSNNNENDLAKDMQEYGVSKFIMKASLLPSQVFDELLSIVQSK